jgi:hypothetical protein
VEKSHSILAIRYDEHDSQAKGQFEMAREFLLRSGSGLDLTGAGFYVESTEAGEILVEIISGMPLEELKLRFEISPCNPDAGAPGDPSCQDHRTRSTISP